MNFKYIHIFTYITLILVIIGLFVAIESTNYHIIKFDTKSIDSFNEHIGQIDSVYINISKTDINKAISKIEKSKAIYTDDNDELMKILEKQKDTFSQIIVFLTLLIAAAGLFNIVQSLTSKSEQEKFKELTIKLEKDIGELKFQLLLNDMIRDKDMMNDYTRGFLLASGKVVDGLKTLNQLTRDNLTEYNDKLNKINMYDRLYNNDEYVALFSNWIISTNNYAINQSWLTTSDLDDTKSIVIEHWMELLSSKMAPEIFKKLINRLNKLYDLMIKQNY